MKKISTLLTITCLSLGLSAQENFSDDFESYSAGDYIGVESDAWTTWSGATGGAEDAVVVDDFAFSGTNSIYFSSTAVGGGPQDVVLPFAQAYDNGQFAVSSHVRVEEGANAYWNIQGEEVIGTQWTLDFNAEAGFLTLSEGVSPLVVLISTEIPVGDWFKWEVTANIDDNVWELLIDDVSVGTFTSAYNKVASIDIFPIENSSFWMDDVAYSWEESVGLADISESTAVVSLFPNPAVGQTSIDLELNESAKVAVKIMDTNGKLISNKSYGTLSGKHLLAIDTEAFSAGIYFVQIFVGNEQKVLKLALK